MPKAVKAEKSDMREIAKRQLNGRGYIVRLSTAREGDNLIGKMQVTQAATDEIVARIVSVGRVDGLEVVFGVDAAEGLAREFMNQAMGLADLLKFVLPGTTVREE